MTARETIMLGNEGARFRDVIDNLDEDIILECMHDYAKEKCQELLEIVAEKAKIKTEKKSQYGKNRKWQKVKDNEEFDLFYYEMRNSVDKSSILDAVNLDEFIN